MVTVIVHRQTCARNHAGVRSDRPRRGAGPRM